MVAQNCDACIVDLDHHCHFINNCVGRTNRHTFFKFVAAASSFGLFAARLNYWTLGHVHCPGAGLGCMMTTQAGMFWMMASAGICGLWILTLLLQQVYLIALNSSSYLATKGKDVAHFKSEFSFEDQQQQYPGCKLPQRKHFRRIWAFITRGEHRVVMHPRADDDETNVGVVVLGAQTEEAQEFLRRGQLEADKAEARAIAQAKLKEKFRWCYALGEVCTACIKPKKCNHDGCNHCPPQNSHVVQGQLLQPVQQLPVVMGKVVAVKAPGTVATGVLSNVGTVVSVVPPAISQV
jgi:multidrug transporter EmrE-like cation transporter